MKDGGGETYPCLANRSLQGPYAVDVTLIGTSASFRRVLGLADAVAGNDCVVLLEGESGTGKELLARRIHSRSSRADGPFIPVNCPAITESLFESQFYGHVKGSFTGAASDTLGIVRAAEGGTLLLDEIGELPLHLQSKLLRLLQEHEVIPVGATHAVPVNVRFIASTNCNLPRRVTGGTFRADLYHRLNIVRIEIPPLRNRTEDIEPLLKYYLEYFAKQYAMPLRHLSPYLRACLVKYPWPGNVRELCGYVERLYAANLPPMPPGPSEMDGEYAPTPVEKRREQLFGPADSDAGSLNLAAGEAKTIRRALELTQYNRSAAAKLLKIHRSTLIRKMRLLGLDGSESQG
jgi:transcriptional regulator with PAS, ATPase and Fis domain